MHKRGRDGSSVLCRVLINTNQQGTLNPRNLETHVLPSPPPVQVGIQRPWYFPISPYFWADTFLNDSSLSRVPCWMFMQIHATDYCLCGLDLRAGPEDLLGKAPPEAPIEAPTSPEVS